MKTYELVYTADEVKKAIDALMAKYKDPGCDGLPYYPKAINVHLHGFREEPLLKRISLRIKALFNMR